MLVLSATWSLVDHSLWQLTQKFREVPRQNSRDRSEIKYAMTARICSLKLSDILPMNPGLRLQPVVASPNSLRLRRRSGKRPVPVWGVIPKGLAAVAAALVASSALAADPAPAALSPLGVQAYRFDSDELSTLRYSRKDNRQFSDNDFDDKGTELSFKLSPGKFEFSRAGVYGLAGVFGNPSVAVENRDRSMPEFHRGFSYSAGVLLEEDPDIPDTAYISSSQLGISYGRMGRVWYNGVDLTVGQFTDDSPLNDSSEVLSLDFTTGRRLSLTGLGRHSPLWLLSLRGDFDIQSLKNADNEDDVHGEWYLNPSLFWKNPGFTMSAQLQVPVDEVANDFEEPDYRLRAVFEKQFR